MGRHVSQIRTESHRQRLRVGPVLSPRYFGARVRVRGSSDVRITGSSSQKFRDSFSVNHQEFDDLFTINGSGKRPLTRTLSPDYRGEGTYAIPLIHPRNEESPPLGFFFHHSKCEPTFSAASRLCRAFRVARASSPRINQVIRPFYSLSSGFVSKTRIKAIKQP